MFDSALLPISFNEPLPLIKTLAAFLKNFDTKRIILIHVVSSGLGNPTHARKRLDKIAAEILSDAYETEAVIRSGSESLEICRVAEERQAAFICIPWIHKNFLQRALLGSTSQDIVRMASVPVFVYKARTKADTATRLERILYAVTTDPLHHQILPYLKHDRLAAQTLLLLHVGERAPDPEAEKKRRKKVFAQLNHVQSECATCFQEVKPLTSVGNPKSKILKTAKRWSVDLILLGKHEQAQPLENLLGSTAEGVAYKSRCSVLIIPATRGKES